MRAWVMSDLHVDSTMFRLPSRPPRVDVLIIAGDASDGHERSAAWLAEYAVPTGLPVLFVPGNHDFFGHDLHTEYEQHYTAAGVTILHPGRPSIEIAGTRFVGLTLWTDYKIGGDEASAKFWAKQNMPDMLSIDVGLRRLGPRDLLEEHLRQRSILEEELCKPFDGSTVVITHHAPHPGSLRSEVTLDASDGSFASDLRVIMERHRPAVWIHGHTHTNRDYFHGTTRVVCNPRGPVLTTKAGGRVENGKFIGDLVVEV